MKLALEILAGWLAFDIAGVLLMWRITWLRNHPRPAREPRHYGFHYGFTIRDIVT